MEAGYLNAILRSSQRRGRNLEQGFAFRFEQRIAGEKPVSSAASIRLSATARPNIFQRGNPSHPTVFM